MHRDLSARNVLVAVTPGISTELTALGTPVNAVCKVADFGLSRGVGSKDYYRMGDKSSPIPIRWMAPETLRHGTSSTEGDVWSFGVFLWEVYSLGCRSVCLHPQPACGVGPIYRSGPRSTVGKGAHPVHTHMVNTYCQLLRG